MRSSGCPRSGSPSTAVDTRGSVWGPVPAPLWSPVSGPLPGPVSGPLPGPVSGPLREAGEGRCSKALTWKTRGAPRGPAGADYFPTAPSPAPDVSTRSVDTLVLAHRLALQPALQLAAQVALQLASGLAVQLASRSPRPSSRRGADLEVNRCRRDAPGADYFSTEGSGEVRPVPKNRNVCRGSLPSPPCRVLLVRDPLRIGGRTRSRPGWRPESRSGSHPGSRPGSQQGPLREHHR